MAESCHKNIQKTEKCRAEKCLSRFVADTAPRGAGLVAPRKALLSSRRLFKKGAIDPNGVACNSPEAAPWEPMKSIVQSPEGAAFVTSSHDAPLGLPDFLIDRFPGRCPLLSYCAPLGLFIRDKEFDLTL